MKENNHIADILVIVTLFALLMAVCYAPHDRNMETSAMQTKIAALETELANLRPVPRIHIQRGTVYTVQGELLVDTPVPAPERGK